jgi:hypothetical protein
MSYLVSDLISVYRCSAPRSRSQSRLIQVKYVCITFKNVYNEMGTAPVSKLKAPETNSICQNGMCIHDDLEI